MLLVLMYIAHCWACGFSALTLLVVWQEGHPACENWVVGCWCCYLSGARCRLAYGPADAIATHSLASVKSRLVLPFWYRLTRVVPDKGPLNRCKHWWANSLWALFSHLTTAAFRTFTLPRQQQANRCNFHSLHMPLLLTPSGLAHSNETDDVFIYGKWIRCQPTIAKVRYRQILIIVKVRVRISARVRVWLQQTL